MKQYLTIDIGGSLIKHAVIDEALNLSCRGTLSAPQSIAARRIHEKMEELYD